MKGLSIFQRKGLFWLGVSALLIWHGPLSAADNASAPELAEDAARLADLGERYLAAGDAAGLAAVEKKLAGMKADRPSALLVLGRLLHHEEKDAEAAQVLEQALALKPEDPETERELGPVYSNLGQYEKAARVMNDALRQRPQDYGMTVDLARCYARMGRLEQAKAEFASAKRINGKEADAYISQGYAYLNAGQDAQGRREFESFIAVDTASPFGYHHLGTYFKNRGQYHEAEEYLQQAVKRLESDPLQNPGDLGHSLSKLGKVLQEQGRLAEAEAVYRKGLEQTRPDHHWRSEFLVDLGVLVKAQGKPAEAEQLYKQAMAACEPRLWCSRRDWEEAAFKLGVLYAAQNRNSEAMAVAEWIGKSYDGRPINEETINGILQLGVLYTDLGQNVKAEALLRRIFKARETMPANLCMGHAEAALADICRNQGRWAEAEDLYLKAIVVFRFHGDESAAAGALDGLATVYEKEGKSQEAETARRQAEALRAQGGKL